MTYVIKYKYRWVMHLFVNVRNSVCPNLLGQLFNFNGVLYQNAIHIIGYVPLPSKRTHMYSEL